MDDSNEFRSELAEYEENMAHKWDYIGYKLKQTETVKDLRSSNQANKGKLSIILDKWIDAPPKDLPVGWATVVCVLKSKAVKLTALADRIEKEKSQSPRHVNRQRMDRSGLERDGLSSTTRQPESGENDSLQPAPSQETQTSLSEQPLENLVSPIQETEEEHQQYPHPSAQRTASQPKSQQTSADFQPQNEGSLLVHPGQPTSLPMTDSNVQPHSGCHEQGPHSSTGYQHPVVGSDSGSQPVSIDLRYLSAVHDGPPREEPFSNLPPQSGRVSRQEDNLQPIAGYDSRSGPASQSNRRAPSGDLMQPTAMQPGYSTLHGGISRNPPVPNTTSQGQFVPQQQQSGNPQSADTAQLFRLLPSGLSGTANEPLTKEQLTRIFLQAKRQLRQNSRNEADFGQNEGQRCIPVHKLVDFYRGVFRIEINYRERGSICRGSGFFVKVEKQHWILTACHNLLSADDGGLMKEGKWTNIMVLVEGKWCKIKTLDQALQREALKVKMQENLLQAEFLLPDNKFELTERQSLDQVIPNVAHFVFDPMDDILAIPCVDPERLELECGAKATAFHLDPDVMQQYTSHFADLLAIVHCPWDMPAPDGWRGTPPRGIVQYNHGTLCDIDGTAIRYDMVTYPGSSGSPVFFCGDKGIVLVGVHRRSHISPLNQCSHLTAEFITNEMLA